MIYLIYDHILDEMADVIRDKNGKSDLMTPEEMAEAIRNLILTEETDDPYKEYLNDTLDIESNYIMAWASPSVHRDDIVEIGPYAFATSAIKGYYFPNAIYIGKEAFANSAIEGGVDWWELTYANLPDGYGIVDYDSSLCYWPNVKSIGSGAFRETNLSDVLVAPKATSIGVEAFRQANIKYVHCGNLKTIGDRAFYQCSFSVVSLVMPNVERIGEEAFYGAQRVGFAPSYINPKYEMYYPYDADDFMLYKSQLRNVKHIGARAFKNCDFQDPYIDLTAIEYIGDEAFNFTTTGRHPDLVIRAWSMPTTGENIFGDASRVPSRSIYVPDNSVEDYKRHSAWKQYADWIKPLSTCPYAQEG